MSGEKRVPAWELPKPTEEQEQIARRVLGEQDYTLFHQIRFGAESEREQARNILLVLHEGLVGLGIKLIRRSLVNDDDLTNAGREGLNKALRLFDYARGARFSTYAMWWIKSAMRRIVGNEGRTVRIPIYIQTLAQQLLKVRNEFWLQHGENPSEEYLVETLGLSVKTVRDALQAIRQQSVAFEYESVGGHLIADAASLQRHIPTPEELYADAEERRQRRHTIDGLLEESNVPHRYRFVISRRFGLEEGSYDAPDTLDRIGVKLGVTRERVRQIEARTLEMLKCSAVQPEIHKKPLLPKRQEPADSFSKADPISAPLSATELMPQDLKTAVCRYFLIEQEEMTERSFKGTPRAEYPRLVLLHLLVEHTDLASPEIDLLLNYRAALYTSRGWYDRKSLEFAAYCKDRNFDEDLAAIIHLASKRETRKK